MGLAVSSAGDLLISDDANRIRVVSGDFIAVPPEARFGFLASAGYAGDPVDTATGNFTETDTDLDFPDDVFGLTWSRSYNSRDATTGPLGTGWSAGFGLTVSEEPGGEVRLREADGRRVSFHPDGAGGYRRPEELHGDLVRDADGSVSVRYDAGEVDDFDAGGRLAARTNWDGQAVTFSYVGDRLDSAASSAGYTLSFTYDPADRISEVVASDGRTIRYGYAPTGALATVTAPDGGVTTYETDEAGRVTRVTDPDGTLVIANRYDGSGRVLSQDTPSGDRIDFAYEDRTGVTTVIHAARGALTRYGHDRQGRVSSVTDAHGKVLSKSYDAGGNLVSVTDRRGAAMAQSFDPHGNLTRRSSPEGVVETFAYDSLDRLISSSNGTGATTTLAYEGSERSPATVVDANAKTTTFDVVDGLVRAVTDADGVVATFGYDARRNRTRFTDAAGKTTSFGYDGAGNRTSETTPLGRRTSLTYDARRRLTSLADPAGARPTSPTPRRGARPGAPTPPGPPPPSPTTGQAGWPASPTPTARRPPSPTTPTRT